MTSREGGEGAHLWECGQTFAPAVCRSKGRQEKVLLFSQRIRLFPLMPEKTPKEMKAKTASLADTRKMAKPLKLKLTKHLKGLGKLEEAAEVKQE